MAPDLPIATDDTATTTAVGGIPGLGGECPPWASPLPQDMAMPIQDTLMVTQDTPMVTRDTLAVVQDMAAMKATKDMRMRVMTNKDTQIMVAAAKRVMRAVKATVTFSGV